jgi:hypothetical protein
MKNRYVLFALIPLLILLELVGFTTVGEFISAPEDVMVVVGVLLLCVMLAANFYLVKFLINKFKSKSNPNL